MKKNVASQVVGAEMISATDGSAFTGSVTCYVTGDNGSQAVGSVSSGACTHRGNGYHSYAPAQAETNYGHVAFTFIGTGAIPATVQIYTSFPQTVDNATALTTIAGYLDTEVAAILAAVDTEVAAIKTKTDRLTFTVANKVDANIKSVNDVTVTGTGAGGDEWGP